MVNPRVVRTIQLIVDWYSIKSDVQQLDRETLDSSIGWYNLGHYGRGCEEAYGKGLQCTLYLQEDGLCRLGDVVVVPTKGDMELADARSKEDWGPENTLVLCLNRFGILTLIGAIAALGSARFNEKLMNGLDWMISNDRIPDQIKVRLSKDDMGILSFSLK